MAKKQATQDTSWEIKDRTYFLKGPHNPLTLKIHSKHTARHPLLWYDTEKNEQREVRYATNQNSPFKDEQAGEATLGHIRFKEGSLLVQKKDQALQKILSIYHPLLGVLYTEQDIIEEAKDDLFELEMELEAMNIAKNIDIDQCEAILRVEIGSKVNKMTSKEVRRDVMIMARNNPSMFLELASDDNVEVRNIGIKAQEQGIIKLASDQRTFKWASNGRKLMTVPFDENPYSALAAWFKTDEGVEVYKSIEKRL